MTNINCFCRLSCAIYTSKSCNYIMIIFLVVKIEDYHTHVWNLSPEQRKQLILSAVVGGYSSALESMKKSLSDYNKTLESYEVKKKQ